MKPGFICHKKKPNISKKPIMELQVEDGRAVIFCTDEISGFSWL
jgi:hypothetical protein